VYGGRFGRRDWKGMEAGMNFQEKIANYKRVWAEVDLDKIVYNMQNLKGNVAEDTKLFGVVKTDGYGHGSVPIAKKLEEYDFMFGFAVATPEEAHILRMAGICKPILILGYSFPYAYEMLAKEEIRPAIFREDCLEELSAAAKKIGKNIRVHIKVDTGMNRIGIRPDEEGLEFVRKVCACEGVEVEGIFTHFFKSDETDKTSAMKQLNIFCDFVNRVEAELGIRIPYKHCANSAAIMDLPETSLDLARAGIAMYGLFPSEEVSRTTVALQAALSLYSTVVYVKEIEAGETVSYGGTFSADKTMRIATVPVGYGDGYPRSLSGKGWVLIRGKKAPILGRVCMDQFMVDVTEIPEASAGDKVVLLGKDGQECISAEDLGELSGRFNYELVCDLCKRIPRVYLENGKVIACKDYSQDFE